LPPTFPPDLERTLSDATRQHARGNLDAAERAYRTILDREPAQPDALHYLGVVALQRGRVGQAIELLRQALAARPEDAGARINLGNAYQAGRDFEAAAAEFERVLARSGPTAVVLANLGNALAGLGHHEDASERFEAALELDPELIEVRRNLAETLVRLGRMDDAARQVAEAEALGPASIGLLVTKGNVQRAMGRPEDAIGSFEAALTMKPDAAAVRCNLAGALRAAGRTDEAVRQYRHALEQVPGYCEGHVGLGVALKDIGDNDGAAAAFRRALTIDGGNAAAYHGLAGLPGAPLDRSERDALRTAIDTHRVEPARRGLLNFALGRCHEAAGEHVDAAACFVAANAALRASFDYSVADDVDVMQRIMDRFDAAFIERLEDAGDPSRMPIFVIGMPRSGTTLVEQILASHPEVCGAGELSLLPQSIGTRLRMVDGVDYSAALDKSSPTDLRAVAEHYVEGLERRANGEPGVTDKLPNNFLNVGMIRLILPRATIVHCRRDPRDTCFSIFKHHFAASGHRYAYDLDELARYYIAYERLMAHWESLFPGHVHTVVYEELVAYQEGVTRALLEACGLDFDPSCLAFHETERPVATISATQVRQPLYGGSIGAWRNYSDVLEPLIARLASAGCLPGD